MSVTVRDTEAILSLHISGASAIVVEIERRAWLSDDLTTVERVSAGPIWIAITGSAQEGIRRVEVGIEKATAIADALVQAVAEVGRIRALAATDEANGSTP